MQGRYHLYPVITPNFDKPVCDNGYDTCCPRNAFTDFIVADRVMLKQPGYKQKSNTLACYAPLRERKRHRWRQMSSSRTLASHALRDFQSLRPELGADA